MHDLSWAGIHAANELAERGSAMLGEMLCAWHCGCTAQADGTCDHPILGSVAICGCCAVADGVDVTPFASVVVA